MNILFVVSAFPTISETFIVNQIVDLQKKGHLVHIYSNSRSRTKIIHEMVLKAGLLKVTFYPYVIPHSRISRIVKLLSSLSFNISNVSLLIIVKSFFRNRSNVSIYNFIPFLNKPEYNIVHAHFGINGNSVTQFKKLGLFRNAKFVTTFHGYDLEQKLRENNFYRSLFANCNLFTVNTNYSRDLLVSLGCVPNKIEILPVGLDIKSFTRNPDHANDIPIFQILFVGRLTEFKAPDKVVEICRILKERNKIKFSVKIIGEGPMLQQLQRLIFNYNMANEIEILGAKSQEDIKMLMDKADIFLYPGITYNGRAENQGLVIQEAQAMQLPVIISDAGGMKEGLIDGVTGFVVKENNFDAFAEKIELLASDEGMRKRMGEEGRKFVIENYDIEKLNDKLIKIYLSVK